LAAEHFRLKPVLRTKHFLESYRYSKEATMLMPIQIEPIAAVPIVTPAPAVGTRNQAETTQAYADARAAHLKAKADNPDHRFPPDPDLKETLRSLDEAAKPYNIALNFSRDDETGTIVIKLVDQTTGETVRQIPSEVRLHLSASLGKLQENKLQGQLINRKV
jgi:flagellar protein FlaG